MVFQFLVRLRTYSVSFVSSVVENVASTLVITKWLRTPTTEAQSALENLQRRLLFYYTFDTARNHSCSGGGGTRARSGGAHGMEMDAMEMDAWK